jgi:peptidoglycan/LPS O-acetylase OafA/YrhL
MSRPILPPLASSHAVRELDGLRGIAILMVVLHHLWPSEGPLARFLPLANLGWLGVDLFFAISGALITGILVDSRGKPAYFRNFYARRALRIFPLYYLFVAAAFVAPLVQHGSGAAFLERSGSPVYYVFYLGNVPEAFFGKDPPCFLAVLWSLAIEEQFYVSFPFVVRALSPKALVRLLAAIVALAPLLRLALALAWPENPRLEYLFLFCRADVIALGGLVAIAMRDPSFRPSRRIIDGAVVVSLGAVAVAARGGALERESIFGRTAGYSLVAFAFASLVLFVLANREAARTRALRFAPLCYLGQLCYGLYLLHRPADVLVGRVLSVLALHPPAAAVLAIDVAAAVGIATASYYALEKPLLRLKRHFARDGSARPEAPAAADDDGGFTPQEGWTGPLSVPPPAPGNR